MKTIFLLLLLAAIASHAQSPPEKLTVENDPLRLSVGFIKTEITPDKSADMFGYEPSATPSGFTPGDREKLIDKLESLAASIR